MCPLGKVNDDLNITGDTFKDGTPITEPHEFGTPITEPHEFGNVIPVSDPTKNSNPVTWSPSPAHFGNNNPLGAVAATPTFSPVAGAYGPTQNVTISSTTPGAAIYYTTNGSTPTTGSTLYSGPVSVAVSETLKAIAVVFDYKNSGVASAAYTINGQVATPTFSPVAGTYTPTSVTLSSTTSGATFYYTTDGSTPTTGSTLYVGPISVTSSETIKVLAVKANYVDSNIASAVYTIQLPMPLFSPATSNTPDGNVAILESISGSDIYYTTNGSTPTISSTHLTSTVSISTVPTPTRNNFDGGLGFFFEVSAPITLKRLGRYYHSSNTQDHPINLWISTDHITPIASGTILASSASDGNGFKWTDITPVFLTPGNTYTLIVDEFDGGDVWNNLWNPVASSFLTAVGHGFGDQSSYPTNGSLGNGSPEAYSSGALDFYPPVNFASPTTIKAIAIKTGYVDSAIASTAFVVAVQTPITVLNPGFESPAQAVGGYSTTVTSWSRTGLAGVLYVNGETPSAFAGHQVLVMASGDQATQATAKTIVAGETYVLSVQVAGRFNNATPTYNIALTANGVNVATAAATISTGVWHNVVISWVGDSAYAGQTLGIFLNDNGVGQDFYDAISLGYF